MLKIYEASVRGVNHFEKNVRDWMIYGIFSGIYGIYEIFLGFLLVWSYES